MLQIIELLQGIELGYRLAVIAAIIVVDWVLGILLALRSGEFQWTELPRFLWTNVFRYGGGYAAMQVVFQFGELLNLGELGLVLDEAVIASAWAAVCVKFVADVVAKVRQLWSLFAK